MIYLGGCDGMPGKPKLSSQWRPASAISDFQVLYRQNCLACHGDGQTIAGSISMNNPIYLSFISSDVLEKIITNGIPHTGMPGFSTAVGGELTTAQIKILVDGIFSRKPSVPIALPPYSAPLGDPIRGVKVFSVSCASCHGVDGKGGDKAGSVVNSDYLNLVSDQYLRTIVIAGRPDLGCPDIIARAPGHPLTNENVADVTAWLVSQRKNEFGQPLKKTQP